MVRLMSMNTLQKYVKNTWFRTLECDSPGRQAKPQKAYLHCGLKQESRSLQYSGVGDSTNTLHKISWFQTKPHGFRPSWQHRWHHFEFSSQISQLETEYTPALTLSMCTPYHRTLYTWVSAEKIELICLLLVKMKYQNKACMKWENLW